MYEIVVIVVIIIVVVVIVTIIKTERFINMFILIYSMVRDEKRVKDKIYNFLLEREEVPTTTKQIMASLNITYPTILKWLAVLEAEGKIKVSDYGNIKFYYINKNGNSTN